MIVLLVLVSLLVILLLWVVFAPINLYVNTWEQLAYAELFGIARFRFTWSDDRPLLRFRIFFFEFTPKASAKKPKPKKARVRKRSPISPEQLWRSGIALLNTFRVKRMIVRLDTGNYPVNAFLIPLFVAANTYPPADCSINFSGESGLECHIQNRISRMLPVILKMRKLFLNS